jgi:hypothetical protein
MDRTAILITVVVLAILLLLLRKTIMRMVVRGAIRWQLGEVGRQAVAKQPGEIHLIRRDRSAWTHQASYDDFAPLLSKGFEDAGTYAIDVLPDVLAKFFVNPATSVYAVLYAHAKTSRVWANFITLYTDGTRVTYSNAPGHGLNREPNHEIVHEAGATAPELYKIFLARRAEKEMRPLDRENVITYFEQAYAESAAWRKKAGFTPEEVIMVARKVK